jgi:hypothetical protein
MKTLFLLTTLLVTFSCESQIFTNEFKTVLITNWVVPGPYLRVVNGQVYNTAYSKHWDDVAILSTGRPHSDAVNPNHIIGHSVEVESVADDKITCGIYETEYAPETYSGVMMPDRKTYVKSVVIYNYPNPKSLVTGQIISGQNASCQCIRVENYITKGVSYEAYDCGIQSTNLVPVITKTKIRIANTNSVEIKP